MVDKVIFTIGIVFWCFVLYCVMRLVAEAIWASIVTTSWLRFLWRAARLRGANLYPTILKFPALFLNNWPTFFGFRKGNLLHRESNGVWKGVGDWTVHPPSSPFEANQSLLHRPRGS